MIVDDDFDTALVVKLMLQSYGHEVDMFIDPRVALSNFERHKYSLAILDLKMKGIDGLELYERLFEMDNMMKVCFMSGYENPDELAVFMSQHSEVSSVCFLKKPLGIEDFANLVKRLTKEAIMAQTGGTEKA